MRIGPASSTVTASADVLRRVLVAVAAAVAMAATIYALGRATGSVQQHGMLVAGAAAGAIAGIWFGLRCSPLRVWALGGVVGTLVVAMALGGALSQSRVVDEQVVQADAVAEPAGAAGQPARWRTPPAARRSSPPRCRSPRRTSCSRRGRSSRSPTPDAVRHR